MDFLSSDEHNKDLRERLLAEQKLVERNRKIFAFFSMSILEIWEHFTVDQDLKEIVFIRSEVTAQSFIRHLQQGKTINEFESFYPKLNSTSLDVLYKAFNPKGDCDNDMIGQLQRKSIPLVSSHNIKQFIEIGQYLKATENDDQVIDLESKSITQFIKKLNQATSYLIIGGIAVNHHGHIRCTKELDIWCSRPQDLMFLKVPKYVNIFFDLDTLTMRHFWGCYYRSERIILEGHTLQIIGFDDLLFEKRSRHSILDQSDILHLEKTK